MSAERILGLLPLPRCAWVIFATAGSRRRSFVMRAMP
jgi:hypothetical protein